MQYGAIQIVNIQTDRHGCKIVFSGCEDLKTQRRKVSFRQNEEK